MAEARDFRVHADPETGEVDEQKLAKVLYEIGVLLRLGGGGVTLLANRRRVPDHPAELPTERFTESVDVRWMARTDTPPRFEEVPPPPSAEKEPAGADAEESIGAGAE